MTSRSPERPTGDPPRRRALRRALGALRPADRVVVAGAVAFLLCALVPWYSADAFDLGQGYRFPRTSVDGFDSGLVVVAVVLVLLAAAWVLLPIVADVPVRFPRSLVTVGLAAPAVLLTLVEVLSDLDIGFSATALLALLAAAAVLAGGVLALLPELRRTTAPSGPTDAVPPAEEVAAPAEAPPSAGAPPADDAPTEQLPYRGPPPTRPPADPPADPPAVPLPPGGAADSGS